VYRAPRTLAAIAIALVCLRCTPAPAPGAGAAECARLRDDVKRAQKKLTDVTEAAPAADAALDAVADHTQALGKTAGEVARDFATTTPQRHDVKEAADGVRMLGELAAGRLEALAKSLRALAGAATRLDKLEAAANDAAEGLGPEAAKAVGCQKATGGAGCAALVEALDAASQPGGVPLDVAGAARASRAKAAAFDELGRAVDALTPPPPLRPAQTDLARRAKAAAEAYRSLASAFDELGPLQERMVMERQAAQEAVTRLSAELGAAERLCGPPASASASGSSAGSASPAPGSAAAPSAPGSAAR